MKMVKFRKPLHIHTLSGVENGWAHRFTTVAFSTENVAAKHLFSRASIINIKSW